MTATATSAVNPKAAQLPEERLDGKGSVISGAGVRLWLVKARPFLSHSGLVMATVKWHENSCPLTRHPRAGEDPVQPQYRAVGTIARQLQMNARNDGIRLKVAPLACRSM